MESDERGVRSIDHFFVLGAGASYGARENQADQPPLGAQLANYLLQWLNANDPTQQSDPQTLFSYDDPLDPEWPSRWIWKEGRAERLRLFLRDAGDQGFERAAVSLRGTVLWDEVTRLIAFAFLTGRKCCFCERPDLLDEVARRLVRRKRMAVITLNYDMLFEEALSRANIDWGYVGLSDWPSKEIGVPLFKVHGSVNWFQVFVLESSASLAVAERVAKENPISVSGPDNTTETNNDYAVRDRTNVILEMKHDGAAQPAIMALYAPGKPVERNWNLLHNVRTKCLNAIARNSDASATVIGCAIPDTKDDPYFDSILSALGKLRGKKTYVGLDERQRGQAEAIGLQPGSRTLSEFLANLIDD